MFKQQTACWILLAGLVVFLVLVGLAIASYPGGSVIGEMADRYLFWQNFLSALGFTRTVSGQNNLVSHYLFCAAMTVVAIALVPYALTAPRRRFNSPVLYRGAVWLGLISCIGFFLVGWLPYDRAPAGHMVGVVLGFLPWFFIGILELVHRWPVLSRGQVVVLFILPILVAVHGLQGLDRLLTGAFSSGQPIMQKLIVIWMIVLFTRDAVVTLKND